MLIRPILTLLASLATLLACSSVVYSAEMEVHDEWLDDVIYFLMPDRFENGNKENDYGDMSIVGKDNHLKHGFNPKDKGFFHGGDIAGIMKRLDYLEELGVSGVWLSPILKNKPVQGRDRRNEISAGYHGYWVTDFTKIDPHFGTDDELKSLISNLHSRDMKAYFDIIANHTADVIQFRECMQGCSYRSEYDYPYTTQGKRGNKAINSGFNINDSSSANFLSLTNPRWAYSPVIGHSERDVKSPAWLNDPLYYHNRGDSTFSGESSLQGDFYGLDDLFTENPAVMKGMANIYSDWIRRFKPDGFRIDTMKHVNLSFWQSFIPELRKTAKEENVDHFYMFGEVYDNDPRVLSHYTNFGEVPAVLDFAFQSAARSVFATGEPTDKLRQLFGFDDFYNGGGADARFMPTFLGNHDMGRIGYFIRTDQPRESKREWYLRSRLAHAFLIFSRGIPVIYYGDEQGFTGDGGDKDARENMMPSRVLSYNDNLLLGHPGSTKESNFDTKTPLFLDIKQFIKIRKAHKALSRGHQIHRASEGIAGIYAFSRIDPKEKVEYVVILNTANYKRRASFYVASPNMTFEYLLPATTRTEKSSLFRLVEVDIDAKDIVVLKAKSNVPPSDDAPKVKFDNLIEGDRVSGEIELCAVVQTNTLARAKFYITIGKQKKQFLGQDLSPVQFEETDRTSCETGALVYRYFYDSTQVDNNTPVTFTVVVDNLFGEESTAVRNVVIDHRQPEVTVHYQNSRKRNTMIGIVHGGGVLYPTNMEGDKAKFKWPKGAKEISLLFYKRGKKESYDKPIKLNYSHHILPNLSEGDSPSVEIFANNDRRVSSKNNFNKARKRRPDPLFFGRATRQLPLGDTAVYLRGGMNSWGTQHEMIYQGNYAYTVDIKLDPGLLEFKFADDAWSDELNMGGPFGRGGLISGGSSSNLKFNVAQDKAGWHRFTLYSTVDPSGRDYRFYRIEKIADSDAVSSKRRSEKNSEAGSRTIPITINYQNGNKRDYAFILNDKGAPLFPESFDNNKLVFDWPTKTRRAWVYFYTKKNDVYLLDEPIMLLYSHDIRYNIKDSKVVLYISNKHKVNADNNFSAAKAIKPNVLIGASDKDSRPLYADRDLFIRGSFNHWKASDMLSYKGGFQFAGRIRITGGEHEFKFADAQWFHNTNMGLPFTQTGLTVGGHSENIAITIGRRDAGTYDVRLFMLPSGQTFYSLEKTRRR